MTGRGLLLPVLGAVVALVLWTAVAARLPPILLPGPLEVATAAWDGRSTLLVATLATARSALIALVVSGTAAALVAVAFLRVRWLEAAFQPWTVVVQTLPIVAVAPLLVVWLGYGTPVAVASGALASFFPLLTAAHVGLRSAEAEQVELMTLYGASWWQTLVKLRLPASLPFLFAGARVAGGLAVIGAIVGEFIGSNGVPPSLGFVVLKAARTAETGLSIAAVLCATGLSLSFLLVVRTLERRVIGPWFAGGTP